MLLVLAAPRKKERKKERKRGLMSTQQHMLTNTHLNAPIKHTGHWKSHFVARSRWIKKSQLGKRCHTYAQWNILRSMYKESTPIFSLPRTEDLWPPPLTIGGLPLLVCCILCRWNILNKRYRRRSDTFKHAVWPISAVGSHEADEIFSAAGFP